MVGKARTSGGAGPALRFVECAPVSWGSPLAAGKLPLFSGCGLEKNRERPWSLPGWLLMRGDGCRPARWVAERRVRGSPLGDLLPEVRRQLKRFGCGVALVHPELPAAGAIHADRIARGSGARPPDAAIRERYLRRDQHRADVIVVAIHLPRPVVIPRVAGLDRLPPIEGLELLDRRTGPLGSGSRQRLASRIEPDRRSRPGWPAGTKPGGRRCRPRPRACCLQRLPHPLERRRS
jgi:hypothetical protein